jgi:undecaprenyl-diphosphatase
MNGRPDPEEPDPGVRSATEDRPPGAVESVDTSVAKGGSDEPRRVAEWVAGGLLVFFVLDLLVVRVTWTPVANLDADLLEDAHDAALAQTWVVTWSEWISVLGNTPVRWTIIGLLGLLLWRKGMPRAAAFIVAVEVIGTGLNNLIKIAVDRLRPEWADPVATAPGASFPSGHAMNSMTCYALVASVILFSGLITDRRWRRAGAAIMVLPILIGITRVMLGVHYPTDVLGGWLLGLGWVAAATAVVRPWRRDPASQRRLRRSRT